VGASREDFIDPFLRGLAETGFVEGRNVAIEIRSSDGHSERLSVLAADFVRQKVALIFAPTNVAALAAKEATRTIPVVFFSGFDPVETGVVASLNRPGGNLTGVAILATEIAGKRLDLLHELVPAARVVGMLSSIQAEIRDAQSVADSLGVRLLLVFGQTDSEIAAAFASLVEQKAGALLISANVNFDARRDQIIALAARHAIPTMFFYSSAVRVGGLLSYGPDAVDDSRLAGIYAGRILKGEKPADLPSGTPSRRRSRLRRPEPS
jgi:putative tryptophan/tyrosine transport system substrate-binding protein